MLWRKSKMAWMKAYEDHLHDADWFIRGDDDTYMVRRKVAVFSSYISAFSAQNPEMSVAHVLFQDDGQLARLPAIVQCRWRTLFWSPLVHRAEGRGCTFNWRADKISRGRWLSKPSPVLTWSCFPLAGRPPIASVLFRRFWYHPLAGCPSAAGPGRHDGPIHLSERRDIRGWLVDNQWLTAVARRP